MPQQLRLNNKLEVVPVALKLSKIIEDPEKEIPYWSDSFYFQDQAWIELLRNKETSEKLANISDGLKIQNLISTNP